MRKERTRHTQVIEREFDAAASSYDGNRLAGWYKAQALEVLSALGSPDAGTILDIGCGTGWFLREVAKAHPSVGGIGIDLSGAMISRARGRAAQDGCNDLVFLHADWETFEIHSLREYVDQRPIRTAVCISAFHYFADPAAAMGKIFDCLAPGGRLLLLDRAKDNSLLTRLWDVLHKTLIKDQVRFYASEELVRFARNCGFSRVRILARITRYFWKGKLYTALTLISAEKSGAEPGCSTTQGDRIALHQR